MLHPFSDIRALRLSPNFLPARYVASLQRVRRRDANERPLRRSLEDGLLARTRMWLSDSGRAQHLKSQGVRSRRRGGDSLAASAQKPKASEVNSLARILPNCKAIRRT